MTRQVRSQQWAESVWKAQEGDLHSQSASVIQSLQRKHKHNLCLLPAHCLQPCHRMLSQRGSRNVPSEVPLPRKSGWSEDQFPLELVGEVVWRPWNPRTSRHCAACLFLVWSGELGTAGPHTLLGTSCSLGPLCFLLFFPA